MSPASLRTAWPMERTQARRPFSVRICISSSNGSPRVAQACTSSLILSRHSGAYRLKASARAGRVAGRRLVNGGELVRPFEPVLCEVERPYADERRALEQLQQGLDLLQLGRFHGGFYAMGRVHRAC